MKSKIVKTLGLVAAALLALGLAGCSTVRVEPWERGTLSEYSMKPSRDPLAGAMSDHVYFSRESVGGGAGVGGSGCGCN